MTKNIETISKCIKIFWNSVTMIIKDFKYGVQLASYYLPGNFIPHIHMIKTGFEDVDDARLFGLPYIMVNDPKPFDTVLLNYN